MNQHAVQLQCRTLPEVGQSELPDLAGTQPVMVQHTEDGAIAWGVDGPEEPLFLGDSEIRGEITAPPFFGLFFGATLYGLHSIIAFQIIDSILKVG
jgi:hypothetical protein